MEISNKKLVHITRRQHDQVDCGVVCLSMVLSSLGRQYSLEQLRNWSGTSKSGTTLLGLRTAAKKAGLVAVGYEADIDSLKDCSDTTILHVVIQNFAYHYMVCWKYDSVSNVFILSDPSMGKIVRYSPEELNLIWQSKRLLRIEDIVAVENHTKQDSIYKWSLEFVRQDSGLLVPALILGLIMAGLGLSMALFTQHLIDNILPKKDYNGLLLALLFLLLILFIKAGLAFFRQLLLIYQANGLNLRIGRFFFKRLLYLPKSFFDGRKVGDIVARMKDTSRIQSVVTQVFSGLAVNICLIFFCFIFQVAYSWKISLINLSIFPVYFFVYKFFLKKVVKAQYDVLSSYGTTESVFIDIIQNANSIRYFNKQALFNDIIQQSYEFYQSKLVNLGFRGNHLTLIVELINSIVICGVLFSASVLNLQSQLSSGELVSIFQLTMIILSSLGQIVLFNVNIQEAKVAFERMQEYINLSPEVIVDEKNQSTITDFVNLKIKELSFSFPGQLPLLEEANLEINRGEIVVLLGSTGSGKSTLLQIIQKALPFDFGEILVNGKNIDLISTIIWRDYIGFVEQETGIFSGTIMNNITMGEFNADISSFQEFMKELELHVFFEEFPHGYDTVIGKDGIILSGGQKQLVGLARALWKKPQLLLLDEPTSSLDEDTESSVVRLLKRVKPNISILLLTHKRSLCIIANRTYLLHNRKISQITAV